MEPNKSLLKKIMATMQREKYYYFSLQGINNKIKYNEHKKRGPKTKKPSINEPELKQNINNFNNELLKIRYEKDMEIYNEIITQIGKIDIIKLGLVFDSLFKHCKKEPISQTFNNN